MAQPPPTVVTAQPVVASTDSSSPSVAATVGCAVLGLMVLGPVGAVIGGITGAAATMSSKQRQPSLGVSGISLPREAICERNGVTYFAMDVTHTTRGSWRVLRRYREFDVLRDAVRVRYPFPGKCWFGCHGATLEARRRGLEAFINYVALRYTHHGVPSNVAAHMQAFLENGAVQLAPPVAAAGVQYPAIAATPAAAASAPAPPAVGQVLQVNQQQAPTAPAAPAAAPVAPVTPPAPVAPAPAAPASAPAQQLLLSIPVPDSVKPGQLLGVKVPDGRELTVTVPPNCGQQLQLAFDPAAGTLSVVDAATPSGAAMEQGAPEDVFSITVPVGVQPGQTLEVVVHGRRLLLTLPPGKVAGEDIHVRVDAARGCLVPV